MGSRGPISRKNLPPKLRLVDGEKDGHKRQPSAADMVSPTAPAHASKSFPADLEPLWDTMVAELDRSGLLARVDGMALELALLHYRAAIEAARDVDNEGPTVAGSHGERVANPASRVFRAHSAAFTELAKQLGLTFAARARIAMPEVLTDELDPGNPFNPAS